MNRIRLIVMAILFAGLVVSSCGSSTSGLSGCSLTDISEAAGVLSTAATTYASDQTEANCLAYRKSLEDYFNLLDECDSTTEEEIEEIRADLATIEC